MTTDEALTTRRELAQIAWAVLLLDLIAVGLGFLAAPYMGAEARWVGVGLAAWVTLVFVVLVSLNLLVVWVAGAWRRRRAKRGAGTRPSA